jgi:adenine/guanine phosphoribosyltransferase-like PRPP-binding protein
VLFARAALGRVSRVALVDDLVVASAAAAAVAARRAAARRIGANKA